MDVEGKNLRGGTLQWWQFITVRIKCFNFLCGLQHTAQRKEFEVILTVKMETRHPVWGSFGREILAFVIVAELWQPEVARPGNFLSNFCV